MCESEQKETFRGYQVQRESWTIGGRSFDLAWPADMDVLLDSPQTQRRHEKDGYMPYWAQPWPASVLLAEAVLNGEQGEAREAIEIGCGIGLVALAAALMGWRVTASDYDEDALAFASLNAERNGVKLAHVERLDFRNPLLQPKYHYILGADLLYERRNCEPVARWIGSALKPDGMALLTDPNRTAAEPFIEHAKDARLQLELERIQTTAPAGLLTRGRLWRITRAMPCLGDDVQAG